MSVHTSFGGGGVVGEWTIKTGYIAIKFTSHIIHTYINIVSAQKDVDFNGKYLRICMHSKHKTKFHQIGFGS